VPLTHFFAEREELSKWKVEQEAQRKPFRPATLQKGQVAFGHLTQRGILPPRGAAAKPTMALRAQHQQVWERESKKTCGVAMLTSTNFVFNTILLL